VALAPLAPTACKVPRLQWELQRQDHGNKAFRLISTRCRRTAYVRVRCGFNTSATLLKDSISQTSLYLSLGSVRPPQYCNKPI
jgi:hypothetical protein